MPKKSRRQLMVECMQSYRLTGQLFFKLLHAALHDRQEFPMASLPILKILKQHGSLSQSAIARELYHSDAAISRQISILLEHGFVETNPDGRNRRITLVELTPKGETLLQQLESAVTDFLAEILTEMPDQQLQQLVDHNHQLQSIITHKLGKEPHA